MQGLRLAHFRILAPSSARCARGRRGRRGPAPAGPRARGPPRRAGAAARAGRRRPSVPSACGNRGPQRPRRRAVDHAHGLVAGFVELALGLLPAGGRRPGGARCPSGPARCRRRRRTPARRPPPAPSDGGRRRGARSCSRRNFTGVFLKQALARWGKKFWRRRHRQGRAPAEDADVEARVGAGEIAQERTEGVGQRPAALVVRQEPGLRVEGPVEQVDRAGAPSASPPARRRNNPACR